MLVSREEGMIRTIHRLAGKVQAGQPHDFEPFSLHGPGTRSREVDRVSIATREYSHAALTIIMQPRDRHGLYTRPNVDRRE